MYGYRRITLDLKELGESCGQNHVFKIMKNNGITAVEDIRNIKTMVVVLSSDCVTKSLNREFAVNSPGYFLGR
ncbi:IS3 family transposase [Acinetobacter sp. ANC 4862]|uniref:IS3 family transposase n=1 Tax=Acinetobacter sp. ANC 4862 TaxID=2529849 RepID=UPI00338DEF1F